MAEGTLFIVGLVIGLVVGGVFAYALVASQPAKTVTSTVSVTATETSTTTATTTSVSTLITYSIPPTYTVRGSISHNPTATPKFIVFTSTGGVKFNFTVSADTYQGNLTNSLPYTVTLYSVVGVGVLATTVTGGCGTFQQTVAWGSSTIIENWNC